MRWSCLINRNVSFICGSITCLLFTVIIVSTTGDYWLKCAVVFAVWHVRPSSLTHFVVCSLLRTLYILAKCDNFRMNNVFSWRHHENFVKHIIWHVTLVIFGGFESKISKVQKYFKFLISNISEFQFKNVKFQITEI